MPQKVMEHEYFVYMMASRSRTLYVGVTRNLAARVGQHKDGLVPGFTADYACTRLVWFERHQYVKNAILREKQIKHWRREKKIWLIERENATWEDLAANWWALPELGDQANCGEAGPSTALRSGRDDKVLLHSGQDDKVLLHSGQDDKVLLHSGQDDKIGGGPAQVIERKLNEPNDAAEPAILQASVAHGPTHSP